MGKCVDWIGKKFGRLTVIGHDQSKKRYLICKCDCGNTISTFSGNLQRGLTKSCGCLNRELASQRRLEDLTGRVFERLTVLRRADKNATNGNPRWVCQCSCPDKTIIEVSGYDLTRGHTRSCGCLAKELAGTYFRKWLTEDEENLSHVYNAMKQRCYDPNNKSYTDWGGRGITICDEWLNNKRSFVDWALSHGYKPGLTIDRIDNNGAYCPDNCRWVDRTVQANNRRSNLYVTVNGITHTLADWARLLNVRYIEFWKKEDSEIVDMISEYLSRNNLPASV